MIAGGADASRAASFTVHVVGLGVTATIVVPLTAFAAQSSLLVSPAPRGLSPSM